MTSMTSKGNIELAWVNRTQANTKVMKNQAVVFKQSFKWMLNMPVGENIYQVGQIKKILLGAGLNRKFHILHCNDYGRQNCCTKPTSVSHKNIREKLVLS